MISRVLVFGSSGMLGGQLVRTLGDKLKCPIVQISRSSTPRWDATEKPVSVILGELELGPCDYVINASGWIPQKASGETSRDTESARLLNDIVPGDLDLVCREAKAPLLQIGTDCVFSGRSGPYYEDSTKDASDLYGSSKVSGEAKMKWATIVRTSIIGTGGYGSIFSWFSSLPKNQQIDGYVNHLWNGVSTLAFSKLAMAWIESHESFSRLHHWIPKDHVSKFELLNLFAEFSGRTDVQIRKGSSEHLIDRRLGTLNHERNRLYWELAGYTEVPSVRDLCQEFIEGT